MIKKFTFIVILSSLTFLLFAQKTKVVAWGSNSQGQITIPNGMTSIISIAAGGSHSLALQTDGTVVAWGNNDSGQITIPNGLTSVIGIAAGWSHNLALLSDGSIVAWGNNDYGQITIPNGMTSVIGISAGGSHSLALQADGTVVAWGDNYYGQSTVPNSLASVVGISAGEFHNIALKSNGTIVTWGNNLQGQTTFPVNLTLVKSVSANSIHSLALQENGTLVAWGSVYLGRNDYAQINLPTDLGTVTKIAQGVSYNFTIVVVELKEQTITGFNTISNTLAGFSYTFPTTATSGLTIDYSFKTSADNFSNSYNISGNTFSYTDLTNTIGASNNVVTVTVKAMQNGNNTYAAATEIEQTFVVSKITQTITGFNTIPNTLAGFSFTFPTTATSGLTVDYSFKTSVDNFSGSNNISGNTFSYTDLTNAIGVSNDVVTVIVKAIQNGNNTYAAANEIEHTFVVSKITQTITGFNTIPNQITLNAPLTLTGSSSSGLAVTYTVYNSENSNSFVLNSNVVNMGDFAQNISFSASDIATISITANQIGNAIYAEALPVTQTFTLSQANPTITGFEQIPLQKFGNNPYQLNFRSTATNYSVAVSGGPAFYDNAKEILYFLGGGVVTLTGYSAEDFYYNEVRLVQYITVTGFDEVLSLLGVGTNLTNTLSTNPTEMQVQNFASNYVVNIQTNCKWQIATNTDANWLSISPTSGTGNSFINITTETNALATNRVATLSITGCTSLLSTFTLTQKANPILSIEETNTVKTSVYPNPVTNGETFVIENAEWRMDNDLMIYNAQGTVVYSQKLVSETTAINANLASGMYLVKVGKQMIKLMVE